MLIKEIKLRKIIRETLIQEGLLTSAIEEVGHVKIDLGDKTYKVQALGGTTIEGKEVLVFSIPKDLRTKYSKRIKFLKIKKLPKQDYNLDNKFSPGGKLKITSTAPAEPGRYYITKDDLKKSANLEVSKEKLQTGKSSMADYAIEIGGALGMVPALGNPADIGSAIIAAIKDPPDYLLSALCFLCSAPALGLGAAAAKPILRKIGSGAGAAFRVGKALGKKLKDVGIKVTSAVIEKIKKQMSKILNSLKSKKSISAACGKLNESNNRILREAACVIQYDPFAEAIARVQKEIDGILEGLVSAEKKLIDKKKSAGTLSDAGKKNADDLAKQNKLLGDRAAELRNFFNRKQEIMEKLKDAKIYKFGSEGYNKLNGIIKKRLKPLHDLQDNLFEEKDKIVELAMEGKMDIDEMLERTVDADDSILEELITVIDKEAEMKVEFFEECLEKYGAVTQLDKKFAIPLIDMQLETYRAALKAQQQIVEIVEGSAKAFKEMDIKTIDSQIESLRQTMDVAKKLSKELMEDIQSPNQITRKLGIEKLRILRDFIAKTSIG